MYRYIVFEGDTYYPKGGGLDSVGSSDSLEAAIAFAKTFTDPWRWANVLDAETGKVVYNNYDGEERDLE